MKTSPYKPPTYYPKIDIPDGFYMVVDSREQKPLFKGVNTVIGKCIVHRALKYGDYSILGFEDRISIERKSLPDLYSTLGKGRTRFEKEIRGLSTYEWKGLLIEGSEDDCYTPDQYSAIHPNSVYHSIAAMNILGFHIYWAKNRTRARDFVLSRLTKYYKRVKEGR
jgi:DNA excision repair protein ERCC-4